MPPATTEAPKKGTETKPETKAETRAVLPPPETTHVSPAMRSEQYLLDHGWQKTYEDEFGNSRWQDGISRGQKPELKLAVVLPTTGGGTEEVKQMHGPVLDWEFSFREAIAIQQGRDAFAKKAPAQKGDLK